MVTGKTTNNITPFITSDMKKVHGAILTETGFKKGYVEIQEQNHAILHIKKESTSNESYFIIPSFLNAHTHIGDAFVREKNISLPTDINKLVAPPDGLKHRLLRTTKPDEIIKGMIQGLKEFKDNGISTFIDFRENGIQGISLLQKALNQVPIDSLILGRPQDLEVTIKEIDDILKVSDGVGLSSLSDWDYDLVKLIAEKTKKKDKIFAIHASECVREPIKPILDLEPDFIVHMTKGSKQDLIQIKEQQIPLVVCPRSNSFFGMTPNIQAMHEIGNTLLLGTDNFMLNPPSIIDEIKWVQTNFPTLFSIEELFLMNTYNGRKTLLKDRDQSASNSPSSWLIIDARNYEINTILQDVKLA